MPNGFYLTIGVFAGMFLVALWVPESRVWVRRTTAVMFVAGLIGGLIGGVVQAWL